MQDFRLFYALRWCQVFVLVEQMQPSALSLTDGNLWEWERNTNFIESLEDLEVEAMGDGENVGGFHPSAHHNVYTACVERNDSHIDILFVKHQFVSLQQFFK